MRLNEIEKTGWEQARPKVTRALSAASKSVGAEFAPNKSGFTLRDDLGYGREYGWTMAGNLSVTLYVDFFKTGSNKLLANTSILVSGESVRYTGDGGIENERDIGVYTKELPLDASVEEILSTLKELLASIPEAIRVVESEVSRLKAGPKE